MKKIHVKATIELKDLLTAMEQLTIEELEEILKELNAILEEKKLEDKNNKC